MPDTNQEKSSRELGQEASASALESLRLANMATDHDHRVLLMESYHYRLRTAERHFKDHASITHERLGVEGLSSVIEIRVAQDTASRAPDDGHSSISD